MSAPDRYRLRAPASGREAIVTVDGELPDDETGFYDRVTKEKMEVVAKLLPDSTSDSRLPRSPEYMRICPHCQELVERDLSECPICNRRLPALEA
jgi:hypothetical protein